MQQQLEHILSIVGGGNTVAMHEVGIWPFAFLMFVSLVSSFLIELLYVQCYSSRATGSQIHRAFPLLSISITGIFIAIQWSLPLSLGLLGALSIVRFRTPIREPEEIGFVMLVIASSIACATFKLMFMGIVLLVASLALVLQAMAPRAMRGASRHGLMVVAVPVQTYEQHGAAISDLLSTRLQRARLEGVSKNDQQVVMSYHFSTVTASALLALQGELQSVASRSTFNVFFNRPGAL